MVKIADLLHNYHSELQKLYNQQEVKQISSMVFEKVLGFSKVDLVLNTNEVVNNSNEEKLNGFLERLKKHEPVQYVLEEAWFYDLPFYVNQHVLIPRPETEELVQLIAKESKDQKVSILDIGTGSGCIALSLKKTLPQSTVSAMDVSQEALKVAQKNADRLNIDIEFAKGDILSDHVLDNMKFDIIVSNPPYISKNEMNEMASNVLDHEPHLALFVEDENPLLFYERITEFATKNLNPNGRLYFEINEAYGGKVLEVLQQNGFKHIELVKDMNGKERIVKGYR